MLTAGSDGVGDSADGTRSCRGIGAGAVTVPSGLVQPDRHHQCRHIRVIDEVRDVQGGPGSPSGPTIASYSAAPCSWSDRTVRARVPRTPHRAVGGDGTVARDGRRGMRRGVRPTPAASGAAVRATVISEHSSVLRARTEARHARLRGSRSLAVTVLPHEAPPVSGTPTRRNNHTSLDAQYTGSTPWPRSRCATCCWSSDCWSGAPGPPPFEMWFLGDRSGTIQTVETPRVNEIRLMGGRQTTDHSVGARLSHQCRGGRLGCGHVPP